jgi:isopenicillin N synthase-like dioxygenase
MSGCLVVDQRIVELDYNDLVNDAVNLNDEISKAFGVDGVGVLTVKNVPGFVEARARLLPCSRKFALLPEETKDKYVHEESFFSFGWSHGKEKLQGKPDTSKGSFYANPQYDRPVDDDDLIAKFPAFIHPNIWPTEDLPDLEPAFKGLGVIIVSVGKLLAKRCDDYVTSKCPSVAPRKLERIIETSKCCKARLLHYFPMPENAESENEAKEEEEEEEKTKTNNKSAVDEFSSWCGWHNDHGSLTGTS